MLLFNIKMGNFPNLVVNRSLSNITRVESALPYISSIIRRTLNNMWVLYRDVLMVYTILLEIGILILVYPIELLRRIRSVSHLHCSYIILHICLQLLLLFLLQITLLILFMINSWVFHLLLIWLPSRCCSMNIGRMTLILHQTNGLITLLLELLLQRSHILLLLHFQNLSN